MAAGTERLEGRSPAAGEAGAVVRARPAEGPAQPEPRGRGAPDATPRSAPGGPPTGEAPGPVAPMGERSRGGVGVAPPANGPASPVLGLPRWLWWAAVGAAVAGAMGLGYLLA